MAISLKTDMRRASGSRSPVYRMMDRLQARLTALGQPATAFVSSPVPRTFGDAARGRQLLAGNFLVDGEVIEAPHSSIWKVLAERGGPEDLTFHDFIWLDDLVAVGGTRAQATAQNWLGEWIDEHGRGGGQGWVPDVTGRRIVRWINHALFLLEGKGSKLSGSYFRSLGHQGVFLSRRWPTAASGLPRFQALTGIIHAGLSLKGLEAHVAPALKALNRECETQIDPQGAIASRNPEDLLEVLTLLNWAADALDEAGNAASIEHVKAIARIAPTLRALSHCDGGLVRCHGGGRGLPGALDQTLTDSGVRAVSDATTCMGYARLIAGRTSVIADAAAPPQGAAAETAHASTLGFELTSGRRPFIVSCGAGHSFGPDWRRAGRATASHSTLGVDGVSSSRLTTRSRQARPHEFLTDVPTHVSVQPFETKDGAALLLSHNGYEPTHGLSHVRQLQLTADGSALFGTDALAAVEDLGRARFDQYRAETGLETVEFSIRFHLSPDVEAHLDMGGHAVSVTAKSGEVWIFRAKAAQISLRPSVYLESRRLKPRATKQIVLSASVIDYATEVSWSLSKAQATPTAMRDLVRDRSGLK